MKVGILTGGGDCPGLNAVIRAVVKKGVVVYGYEILGIFQGWKGLLEPNLTEKLDLSKVSGILHRGGTILETSRTNPFKKENGGELVIQNMKKLGLEALIAVGGEDTLGVAAQLHKLGAKVVGVPKTIDNDVEGTDYTFGFDTAVNIAMDAIDRVHTTAESHNRVMVVEVMGRHTGWIAIASGIAGGADLILIPEKPMHIDQVCDYIKKRHDRGKDFSIVVVAEGAKIATSGKKEQDFEYIVQERGLDQFGHVRLGGIGAILSEEIEKRTKFETRYVILGYVQRGGSPTAFDRVLATRYGVAAIDLVHKKDFGKMVCLKGNKISSVPLSEIAKKTKPIEEELYQIAEVFFG